jgi:hypothetical protein
MKFVAILFAAALMPLGAQEIRMPANLDKLAAKADETVDVTLDGSLLKLAARFLSGKSQDEAGAKKTLSGLESIVVRSYQFSSEGQYDMADVEAIRAQLKAPLWSRIVGVTSRRDGEKVDVYFKVGSDGNLGGIVVLCTEPMELTIVSLVGTLDPSELVGLGGHFGIPELDVSIGSAHRWREAK